jgi:SAM-dependent methyltransferase
VETEFDRLVNDAATMSISGWNTSPMRGRWDPREPPWSFSQLVRERLPRIGAMLDLGTGGGELLSSWVPLPRLTYATEGYGPNLAVARNRLEPLGVRVLPIGPENRIDLPSGSVDLVTCRHEEYDPGEVYRVLRAGGSFITQQVGARNYLEINERLGLKPAPATNDVTCARDLASEVASGGLLVVDQREAVYSDEFRDVGALTWYLRLAPWQAVGFSPDRNREGLRQIHDDILRLGSFRVTSHRILLVADRPGP